MIERRNRVFLLACVLCTLLPVWGAAPPPVTSVSAPKKTDPSDELFAKLVPRLEIQITAEALSSLSLQPREYVRANVREGLKVYTNVAVKLKGSRGSYRPVEDKPDLTLNFDHFVEKQLFHGLDKLHLNNSVTDPTYLNELIGSELFLSAGVPTARTTQARVILGARDLGLFVLKEGYNKRFLKRFFDRTDGNLYDGGFIRDIYDNLEKDSGSGPNDWSDLRQLYSAAIEPDLARREERLAKVLDLDRFITFAALERLAVHWDGYTGNRNNYRIYNDPTTGRFVFFPHGMDNLFRDSNFPLIPGVASTGFGGGGFGGGRGGRGGRGGILTQSVFDVPDLYRKYLEQVGKLLEQQFTTANLNKIVDTAVEKFRQQLGESEPALFANLVNQANAARSRLATRVRGAQEDHKSLLEEFRPTPK